MDPLISADELQATLDEVVVCDLRWDLTDREKGRANYETGHVPGAVFVDLDRDLSAPPGVRGRHPLPAVADFAATLGAHGIDPETHVVVYDDVSGRVAARMWWMLRSIGHETVQVLDGGFQAWAEGDRRVDTGWVEPKPTRYPPPERFVGVVGLDELDEEILIDARSGERYRGEVEPVDPKAGHIPGAVNIPAEANLDANGRFRSPQELRQVYREVPDRVVVSCGSGVTACHDALALVRAGRPLPAVYVGSFSEWSSRDLPVATGPNP